MTLAGKHAVVTGGGTGIGRAIAIELAAAGASVAVTGRRRALLEETVKLMAGGRGLAQTMDVCDRASVEGGIAAIVERFGAIDVLVNNAGIGGPNACTEDGDDRWDEIVRTNLDGVFFATRAAAPHLPDGGRVVNISSVLGRFGVPGYTAYCTSKHGVIGFTKALAMELAPRRITVNAVCPGWVETEMARAGMELLAEGSGTTYAQAREQALGAVPLGRIIEPVEIAQLVVYLASPAASGMTGQSISLCGGATML